MYYCPVGGDLKYLVTFSAWADVQDAVLSHCRFSLTRADVTVTTALFHCALTDSSTPNDQPTFVLVLCAFCCVY